MQLLKPGPPPVPFRHTISSNSPKLRRAAALFVEYQVGAARWILSKGVHAESPGPGQLALEFPPVPDELNLLLGDCVQDARSALDHEVFRESFELKGKGWPGLEKVQFPVHTDQKTFPSVRGAALAGVLPEVAKLIESFQPFVVPRTQESRVIELLHLAARIDRHRLLHVAAPQPKEIGLTRYRPDLRAVEGKLSVRLEFIDFLEPRLMNLDVHNFVIAAIAVVDDVVGRMRKASAATSAR